MTYSPSINLILLLAESIITMLSHAMTEEQSKLDSLENVNEADQEFHDFEETPAAPSRPVMTRARSRTASKVDFCCLHDNVIRCVCANIIAHIQTTEKSGYVPASEFEIFNKESGSLVGAIHPNSIPLSSQPARSPHPIRIFLWIP